jgi:hypothetical protein
MAFVTVINLIKQCSNTNLSKKWLSGRQDYTKGSIVLFKYGRGRLAAGFGKQKSSADKSSEEL